MKIFKRVAHKTLFFLTGKVFFKLIKFVTLRSFMLFGGLTILLIAAYLILNSPIFDDPVIRP